MYNYETILALLLALCSFALLFPYLTPERAQWLRLTSFYRPISLVAFLFYGAFILLKPLIGTLPLILMPVFVLVGAGAMALEARDKAGLPINAPSTKKLLAGLSIFVVGGALISLSIGLRASILFFNGAVAVTFAWMAFEARRMFYASRSFYTAIILGSAALAAVGMFVRTLAYIDQPVTWFTAFFPDPPGAFTGRIMATFAVFFASIAFNFEDMRLQAVKEKARAKALYGGLFQSLVKAIEGRTDQAKRQTMLTASCAQLLTEKLQRHGWFNIPKSPDFAAKVGQAAPLADLGLIGLPQHMISTEIDLASKDYQLYRRHPLVGKNLLTGIMRQASRQQVVDDGSLEMLELAAEVIEARHENWDGSGFPLGRSAKEIPPAARIVTIAADLVTLAVQDPNLETAFEALRVGAEQKYDPLAVRVLLSFEDEFRALLETGREPS